MVLCLEHPSYENFIFEGIFEVEETNLGATICPRHRDTFGIRWRCNRRNCMCPSEWASHKSVKGDRGITLAQSKRLFQLTEVLIPVASREFLVVMSEHSKRKKKECLYVPDGIRFKHCICNPYSRVFFLPTACGWKADYTGTRSHLFQAVLVYFPCAFT